MKEYRQPDSVFDPRSLSKPPKKGFKFFQGLKDYPFDHTDRKWNTHNAWFLAEASWLVYITDQKYVKAQLKQAGLPKYKFFDNNGTQCFVAHNDNFVVVSFRGTEPFGDIQDIKADLMTWLTRWDKGGFVHSGFNKALGEVWTDLEKYLDKNVKGKKIFWTGHSLGGALATLGASRYGGQGLYTIGSPRVGTRNFVKTVKIPAYRIVNRRDIVTRVPPVLPFMYKHTGELLFIKYNGSLKRNPGWFYRLFQRTGGSGFSSVLFIAKMIWGSKFDIILSYISDHNPQNYACHMWNNISE